jgi:hypothetical protein
MEFAKLMDAKGCQIAKPKTIPGSVSFDSTTGEAHAWSEDGKKCLAEMKSARVVWIGAPGMRLEGHEPVDLSGLKFRLMQWQVLF